MRVGGGAFPWVQARYVAQTGTGHTPFRSRPDLWVPAECNIPWFTLADVWQLRDGGRMVVSETAEHISERGVTHSAAVVHPKGTVLLSRTASVGFSALMGRAMAVSQDFMTWTAGPRLDARFLLYALRAMKDELRRLMYGSTHKTIYMPDLLSLRVPLPPIGIQRGVVDFLDREWERIGSLSEKVLALEALEDEGLSGWFETQSGVASAPMVMLRRVLTRINDGPFGSSLASSHYVDAEEVRVVRLGNIGRAEFRGSDRAFVSHDYAASHLADFSLQAGELVIAGLGDTNHPLGRAAVVPATVLPAIHKADCYRAVVNGERVEASYVALALSFGRTVRETPLLARGSTRARLNTDVARDIRIPLPSLTAQCELVDAFTRVRQRSRSLRSRTTLLLDRLLEYRDALTIEAVTGQLDVTPVSDAQAAEAAASAMEGATA